MTIFSTARDFPFPEFDADFFAFFAGVSGAPADDVAWSGVRSKATGARLEVTVLAEQSLDESFVSVLTKSKHLRQSSPSESELSFEGSSLLLLVSRGMGLVKTGSFDESKILTRSV